MLYQKTVWQESQVEGIGLHTGKPARLRFLPAPPNSGVVFVRGDLPGRPHLPVLAKNVVATQMATTLGGERFSVATVEHCLSAVAALQLDNLIVELDGPEIPIGDGSAVPFFDALKKAGAIDQDVPRRYLQVVAPIYCGDDQKHAYVAPYDGLKVSCTIDFAHPAIGEQKLEIDVNLLSFADEIARARTFGFLAEAERLRAKGLALGGSLENAIVLDQEKVLNPEGLRFADEFVRHKVLDALGDLVSLGYPLLGHLVLYKAGHDVMNRLVRQILASPDSYRLVELGDHPVDGR